MLAVSPQITEPRSSLIVSKASDSFKTEILTSELTVNGTRRRFVDPFLVVKTGIERCRFVGVGFSDTLHDEEVIYYCPNVFQLFLFDFTVCHQM